MDAPGSRPATPSLPGSPRSMRSSRSSSRQASAPAAARAASKTMAGTLAASASRSTAQPRLTDALVFEDATSFAEEPPPPQCGEGRQPCRLPGDERSLGGRWPDCVQEAWGARTESRLERLQKSQWLSRTRSLGMAFRYVGERAPKFTNDVFNHTERQASLADLRRFGRRLPRHLPTTLFC
mmetsp:Transcript_41084/g.118712  ORF Transcript_41084/g.118712 Transcript_41084/m.118712 type:complete len:181 (+) Transcript_41084:62-604(+)